MPGMTPIFGQCKTGNNPAHSPVMISEWSLGNAPVKVNLPSSRHMTDRHLVDHKRDYDNSNSFQHYSDITNGRNLDLLGGESDSES